MTTHHSVRREDHGPLTVLTLNRPDRRNALSREIVSALSDALSELAVAARTRAVILTGAGTVFCAGMDLREADAGSDEETERRVVADTQGLADLYDQLHGLPKPTIAALNGDAYAGGMGLALACDFVLAAEGVKLGFPEVKRGLAACMIMHDIVRSVGERRARELLLTGETILADRAAAWGLINRVVPANDLLGEAVHLGRALIANGPIALATTKRLLDEATSRPKSLRGAASVTAALRVSAEGREGVAAFLERRAARWAGG